MHGASPERTRLDGPSCARRAGYARSRFGSRLSLAPRKPHTAFRGYPFAVAQRRHHYESALESLLRARRIPYIAVDEARRALLPEGSRLSVTAAGTNGEAPGPRPLKSFDFVIYTQPDNLLVEVKGRRAGSGPARGAAPRGARGRHGGVPLRSTTVSAAPRQGSRLENWVTRDDLRSLEDWQTLFGAGFRAAFLFIYWCDAQPADGVFNEVFAHRGRWYGVRAAFVDEYARVAKPRSPRWGTVDVPGVTFESLSHALSLADFG